MCACVCDKEGDRKTGTQQRLQMGTTNKREEKKTITLKIDGGMTGEVKVS